MEVDSVQHPVCLVLMFKAPERSKRRLADVIGDSADVVAEHLHACAREDMGEWGGPTCYAPASERDARWLLESGAAPAGDTPIVRQGRGNLGERIARVSRALEDRGLPRQVFIGIDCPRIDAAFLREARARLDSHDVVLGPSGDGGVVLMGTRSGWPALGPLRWSTQHLFSDLESACLAEGRSVAATRALDDVDTLDDLAALAGALAADDRPARRAFRRWLLDASPRLELAG